jgi:hypothetical protein
VINERFASDPILPLDLFKNKVFSTANLAGFLISMSFMSRSPSCRSSCRSARA